MVIENKTKVIKELEARFIDPFSFPEKDGIKTLVDTEAEKNVSNSMPIMTGVFYRSNLDENEIVYVYNVYDFVLFENEDTFERFRCSRSYFLNHFKPMVSFVPKDNS